MLSYTRPASFKRAFRIDGKGQRPQDKSATGHITHFETGARFAWTTGDATVACQSVQPAGQVKRVTRDLVFIDQRYVITRDRVELADPATLSWLLQAERSKSWENQSQTSWIRGDRASLTTQVVSPGIDWFASITDRYPEPIDPRYTLVAKPTPG